MEALTSFVHVFLLFLLGKSTILIRCLQHLHFKNSCKIAHVSKNFDSKTQHFVSNLLTHSWFHFMLFALPGYQFPYSVGLRCYYLITPRFWKSIGTERFRVRVRVSGSLEELVFLFRHNGKWDTNNWADGGKGDHEFGGRTFEERRNFHLLDVRRRDIFPLLTRHLLFVGNPVGRKACDCQRRPSHLRFCILLSVFLSSPPNRFLDIHFDSRVHRVPSVFELRLPNSRRAFRFSKRDHIRAK